MDEEKKRKVKQAGVVAVFAIVLFLALLAWEGSITGFHSLNTFESEVFVSGSSPDNSLSFEKIPNFIAKVGEEVHFTVNANSKSAEFSDNSALFNITPDGTVDFIPRHEDIGAHNAVIIAMDRSNQYHYQNIRIIIEE